MDKKLKENASLLKIENIEKEQEERNAEFVSKTNSALRC